MYLIKIGDKAELGSQVTDLVFESAIPSNSLARSMKNETVLIIKGRIYHDGKFDYPKEAGKNLAEWSLIPPDNGECYQKVEVLFTHADTVRTYVFEDAFCVSYQEVFSTEEGTFTLILKQRTDRSADITIG